MELSELMQMMQQMNPGTPVDQLQSRNAPQLSQADQESLLSEILGKLRTGLGFVGDVLDTPASVVRNVIHGVEPFRGFLNPEQRTTPEQVGKDWGILNNDNSWGDLGKKILVGIGTDPLTYINPFGTLTRMSNLTEGGQAAKALGILDRAPEVFGQGVRMARRSNTFGDLVRGVSQTMGPEELADLKTSLASLRQSGADLGALASQPLAKDLGVGLPLAEKTGMLNMPGGEAVAKALDKAGQWVGSTKPVVGLKAMFYAPAGGGQTQFGQQVNEAAFRGEEAADVAARGSVENLASAHAAHQMLDPAANSMMADMLENQTMRPAIQQQLSAQYGIPIQKLQDLADDYEQNVAQRLINAKRANGLKATEFGSQYVNPTTGQAEDLTYLPRHFSMRTADGQIVNAGESLLDKAQKELGVASSADIPRQEYIRDLPRRLFAHPTAGLGADTQLNDIIDNGGTLQDVVDHLKKNWSGIIPDTFAHETPSGNIEFKDRWEPLAKLLGALPREVRTSGIFNNNYLSDIQGAMRSGLSGAARAKALLDRLPGIMLPATDALRHPDTKSVGNLLDKLGYSEASAAQIMGQRMGLPTKDVLQRQIPADIYQDLLGANTGGRLPGAASRFASQYIDPLQNLSKAMWTSPNPANWSRNLGSGQAQNMLRGGFSPSSVGAMKGIVGGAELPASIVERMASSPWFQRWAQEAGIQNIDQAGARELLSRALRRYEMGGGVEGTTLGNLTGRVSQQTGANLSDILEQFPGGLPGAQQKTGPMDVLKQYLGLAPGTTGPTRGPILGTLENKVRGLFGMQPIEVGKVRGWYDSSSPMGIAARTTAGPVAAGETANRMIDVYNRGAPWLEKVLNGTDPAQAAREVLGAQGGLGPRHFTPFERDVLSRVMPWYKWMSRNAVGTMRELATNPGGPTAQLIRATNTAQGRDVLPEYVSGGMAIPMGQSDDGTKRYLTGMGLMHEAAMPYMTGNLKDLGMSLFGLTSPWIHGPAQYVTGLNFQQRGPDGTPRRLEDADPALGRLLGNIMGRDEPVKLPNWMEVAASNSPFARLITQGRQLFDPRKYQGQYAGLGNVANLLTGIRVTDVSPKAREAQINDALSSMMHEAGAKSFPEMAFTRNQLASMSPDDLAWANKMRTLQGMLDRARQLRAKQQNQGQPQFQAV